MAARIARKAKRANPVTDPVPMRPGRNGGLLRVGGTNKGGKGQTPSEVRAKCRGSFAERVQIAAKIADDPKSSPSDRLRALDLLAKYGLGTTITETDTEGNDVTIRVIRVPVGGDRDN